ncbi:hypothetical protein Dda_5263 [Drechslerella dactyloides]|uniref:D-serine dehydratase n=1 Tax=Drechslerella dactyloides TaxID=74499 RepID=A0AAD6IVR7_DREDA|nr:hypothetical protein Dda_5263 [Drechslerella dactyloides]
MDRPRDEVESRKDAVHQLLKSYVGDHRFSLPTPSLCVSLPAIQRNCDIFHKSLNGVDIQFRAHVKTHKTEEVTRIELGSNHHAVITSTIREIRGLKPLIADGTVTDVLYGLPPASSYIPTLSSLSREIPNLRLLVDHPAQLKALTHLPPLSGKPWSVFVKLDTGAHRAGLPPTSPGLFELLQAALAAKNVDIYGFYAHAGDSYSSRSEEDSVKYLKIEIETVIAALGTLSIVTKVLELPDDIHMRPYVLSIGATPTAHVISTLRNAAKEDGLSIPSQCKLEIHAGNFPFNDLQQLATGVVPDPDPDTPGSSSLACTLNTEVISIYPDRNEALINAGVLAIGREPGQFPGFARVRGRELWYVSRVSQEHGVVSLDEEGAHREKTPKGETEIEKVFKVGEKLVLDIQHACISAACHDWYFVLDEKEVVKDVWYPWRGWM